jgi:protein O-GlcNAc transferase
MISCLSTGFALKLPHIMTLTHDQIFPERSARSVGEVTFGSFNRLGEVTDEVISLWVKIILSTHNSKLILKASEFLDQRTRDLTLGRFLRAGLSAEKVELRPDSPIDLMMKEYNDIDIALDPFSFTDCATTCVALWMGVPVITLPGESVVSRQGLSILSNIGRKEWIADDADQYVQIAKNLADSIRSEGFDRPGLRQSMTESPLCNTRNQASALSALLREAWKDFCRQSA